MVFLAVGACSAGDSTIDITHDPCSGVTLAGPTDEIRIAGIDGAISLWGQRGVTLARVEDSPTITLELGEAAGAFHGVYDDEHSIIYINNDLVDPAQLAIVIAHEVGHAFGLAHVTDRTSLMNPGNLVTPPTAEDQGAIEALWGACQPVND
jgi:hypothetical protein